MSSTPHPHVALFAFPFASHPGNLFTLARMLAAAAPNATFSFFTSPQSAASLSPAPRPDNIRLREVDDGCSGAGTPNVLERIGSFLGVTPGNFKAGMEAAVKEEGGAKISCVVSDAFLWMVGEVAGEMGVPWAPMWTCGPLGLVAHLFTNELRQRIGVYENVKEAIEHQADQHLSSIPALSAFRTGDLPEGIVFGDVHSPFPTLLHNMATNLPHATLVALNSFHDLHPDIDAHFASSFKKFLHIGPFNLLSPPSSPHQQNKDDECLIWLDNQSPASVVYISFGTVLMPPPPQLEELALGLESSGALFLWALKDKVKEGLPAGFLDRTKGRGLVVSWAPQVQVLGHKSVGAFLTHCGWNSVMESLTNGVPMICKPFLGDQRANARMVSHVWRFGVVLDVDDEGRLRREEVGRVVNVVLKEGEEMRGRVCELKKQGMQAAEPGGSSTQNFKSLVEVVCGMPKV